MLNNSLLLILLAGTFLSAIAQEVRADKDLSARAAIQSAYNDQNAGYAKQDIPAIFSHTMPDFTIGGGGGVGHKPMIMKGLHQLFVTLNGYHGHINRTTEIEKIDINGTQAIVMTRVHVQVSGINVHSGKPIMTEGSGTTRDVWLKTKAGWLEKSDTKLSGTG